MGLIELGFWNYLDKAERAWYMVPCQHGMIFMHVVTAKLPDKSIVVTNFDINDNINTVPRELVKPEVVMLKAEGDGKDGDKAAGVTPAP